ncbi:RusA family crossover junction endodeoxyribonuclease [Glutamicibacter sp.]|jgi:Endodeoxyribonuclease RusA.|uniref:RusA family crossover junction endodeoxyribonuclease n=1 Tax=Glutamicibacter sp. TaxID=1931995 RepID=UPI002FDB18B4
MAALKSDGTLTFVVLGDPKPKARPRQMTNKKSGSSFWYMPQTMIHHRDVIRNVAFNFKDQILALIEQDHLGRVTVGAHFVFKRASHPDLDNCQALIFDAISLGIGKNDRQFCPGKVTFDVNRELEEGTTLVTISPYENGEQEESLI